MHNAHSPMERLRRYFNTKDGMEMIGVTIANAGLGTMLAHTLNTDLSEPSTPLVMATAAIGFGGVAMACLGPKFREMKLSFMERFTPDLLSEKRENLVAEIQDGLFKKRDSTILMSKLTDAKKLGLIDEKAMNSFIAKERAMDDPIDRVQLRAEAYKLIVSSAEEKGVNTDYEQTLAMGR